ncbi:DUF5316 family protein [Tepidibacter aestuarii]|uniref:DUF5316 family protein n=1 Tax=Tepidibacter aestuarii TaxID=2925782 RepID=UPI0020BEEF6A|nr:DUF5316 family protein [Tepidibacter aestuarii]CAH2214328.1 conserved membrane protein of unknown function [Tepidibacter aestuarii]
MNKILWGFVVECLVIIIYLITRSEKFFIYATSIIGFGSLGIGAIVSGLISDNIYRRTEFESSDERHERLDRTGNLILFGIPSIVILIFYYTVIK